MKQILIYTDGCIDTYYVNQGNKHLIITERDNKVVHAHDITYKSRDKYLVDKYLRQLGEPTTKDIDKLLRQKYKDK